MFEKMFKRKGLEQPAQNAVHANDEGIQNVELLAQEILGAAEEDFSNLELSDLGQLSDWSVFVIEGRVGNHRVKISAEETPGKPIVAGTIDGLKLSVNDAAAIFDKCVGAAKLEGRVTDLVYPAVKKASDLETRN